MTTTRMIADVTKRNKKTKRVHQKIFDLLNTILSLPFMINEHVAILQLNETPKQSWTQVENSMKIR